MVNIKDLMIGNFVKSTYGIIEVYNVLTNSTITKFDKKGIYIIHTMDIEPIPVTVDMLKRIGFEEDTTAGEPWPFWRYWDKDGRYKLGVYPDELYCNSDRKFGLHVDNDVCDTIGRGEFTYVHELQNLVRTITGFSIPITKEMLYDN